MSACNEHELNDVSLTRWTQWVAGTRIVEGPAKVDVLLVVDDSPSMHDQAGLLASNLEAIAEVYEGERLDYRIGVITTDVSGPDCATGRDGALVRTSCRERLPSFVASANHESPAVDVRDVCVDSCSLDVVTTLPTSVDADGLQRPRPWLERGANGQNTGDPVAALTCMGQVGIAGCTTESPFGAVLHFLERTEDRDDPDFGFMRPDAGLAIVFIGDEDDCSRGSASSLNGDASVSAACWREAADCVEGDDGTSCSVANGRDLVDLEGFIERLQFIDAQKRMISRADEQRVFVSAVAGVPLAFPERRQTFGPGDDPAFERAFGIGAGCVLGGAVAAPSVRTVKVAEAFEPWESNVVSVCGSDWRSALACLPFESVRPLCLDIEPLGGDASMEESCVLMETRQGESRRLPECVPQCEDEACDPLFAMPDGVDACVEWRTRTVSEFCLDRGLAAEATILRREPSWDALEYEVTCAAEI